MAKKKANGEGSIVKRKSGTYQGKVTIGYDENGKQIRKSISGKTRKEVSKKMIEYLDKLNKNSNIEDSNTTLGEWIDIWFQDFVIKRIKTSTRVSYEGHINNHIKPKLGKVKLQKLDTVKIQKFINERHDKGCTNSNGGLSAKTVKNIYNTLNLALEQAVRNNILYKNPCSAVVLPKQEKKNAKFLTLDEQNKLLLASENNRLGIVTQLAIYTGMRLGELLGLKWEDIDFDKRTLEVKRTLNRLKNYNGESKTELVLDTPKTKNSNRVIPLTEVIVERLLKYKAIQDSEKEYAEDCYNDEDFVFSNEIGQPIEPKRYQTIFKEIVKEAGLKDVNFHQIRHGFATNGIALGVNTKVISEILGHSDITTTLNIYSHVMKEVKHEAMEVMNSKVK